MIEDTAMAVWTFYPLDGDPEFPCVANCPGNTDLGPFLVNLVGIGNPCYLTTSIDPALATADELGANFNDGIIISSDFQTNRVNAAAQIANPVAMGADNNGTNRVWKVA